MAQRAMGNERTGHTLHATELVHEAFLRIFSGTDRLEPGNRAQFFVAAGRAMRNILIDHARRHRSQKRGGGRERISLGLVDAAIPEDPEDLLNLNDALLRLEERDPRAAEVVQLRYFAGLGVDETADAMQLSASTVKREWEYARAWLMKQMQ